MAEYADLELAEKEREQQLLEYTTKYYGHFREGYENYVHEALMENFQLICLYDRNLYQRQKEATRIIRQTINIPKMPSEVFARLAQEAKILIGGKPIVKVNAPGGSSPEDVKKHKNVENLTNDLMAYMNWFAVWYAAKFWASIAPWCFIETFYTEQKKWSPTGRLESGTGRIGFEEKLVFQGAKSIARFPWEIFYDFAYPELEPPIFTRHLISDEDLKDKLAPGGGWTIPEGKETSAYRKKSGSRNYGLEIIRSVPRRLGGAGSEEVRFAKDQHEVLKCLGYFNNPQTGKLELLKWVVLNQECIVSGPEVVTLRRTAINYVPVCTRRIPGFSFGLPPGDSAKQINRAINQTVNGRLEAVNYGLVPPFFQGENSNFLSDNPVLAPATGIPVNSISDILPLTSSINPADVDNLIGYLERQSQLITDTNEMVLGSLKSGTPPSAFETNQAAQGQATKIGLFALTEETWLKEWAAHIYWTMMEQAPAKVTVNGRAYDLLQCIVGEPDFDLPQLGEAAGRTADDLQLQAFFSTLLPIFQVPGLSRETNPILFAAIEKYAQSLKLTEIDEILEPEKKSGEIESSGPDEIEMMLQQKDAESRMAMAAAEKQTNGAKGAENGKKQRQV